MRLRDALAVLAAGLLASGCASQTATHAGSASHTPTAAPTTHGAAFSCVRSPAQLIRRAPIEFIAIALAGPSRSVGNTDALVSPARMQVLRWLKGRGPRIVAVQTGISAAGRLTEDGIVPHHGERWRIVSLSRGEPYSTSACLGSVRLPALTMHPGAPS